MTACPICLQLVSTSQSQAHDLWIKGLHLHNPSPKPPLNLLLPGEGGFSLLQQTSSNTTVCWKSQHPWVFIAFPLLLLLSLLLDFLMHWTPKCSLLLLRLHNISRNFKDSCCVHASKQQGRQKRCNFMCWYAALLHRIKLWKQMIPLVICKPWRKSLLWGHKCTREGLLFNASPSHPHPGILIETKWGFALRLKCTVATRKAPNVVVHPPSCSGSKHISHKISQQK